MLEGLSPEDSPSFCFKNRMTCSPFCDIIGMNDHQKQMPLRSSKAIDRFEENQMTQGKIKGILILLLILLLTLLYSPRLKPKKKTARTVSKILLIVFWFLLVLLMLNTPGPRRW